MKLFGLMASTLNLLLVYALMINRCSGKMSDLQLLDSLLENYDRRATPTNHLDYATQVTCEFYIRSFGSIDPSSMDYQVDLYLRQSWVDPRLSHEDFRQPLDLNDPKLVQAIWKPEVYFPNAKKAEFQFVTVPNVLIRIENEGQILYMLRLKLTFACMMEMSKFPLDSQICTMEVASFSKTVKELTLAWKHTLPIKMYKNLRMPQFQIENIVIDTCREPIQIGNYSCLIAEFHLRRSIGFHLVQSYLPTFLIVAISWVSFWMDVDSVPARTTLGVTTLLAVSTKSGIQEGLPQVSYVKAIDVWMGACTAFVFTSLLEFTLVNYLWRRNPKSSTKPFTNGTYGTIISHPTKTGPVQRPIKLSPPRSASMVVTGPDGIGVVVTNTIGCQNLDNQGRCRRVSAIEGDHGGLPEIQEKNGCALQAKPMKNERPPFTWTSWQQRSKVLAQNIDELCRVLFPSMFGLFNICYWSYYLYF